VGKNKDMKMKKGAPGMLQTGGGSPRDSKRPEGMGMGERIIMFIARRGEDIVMEMTRIRILSQ
jgi:hypothetical protein